MLTAYAILLEEVEGFRLLETTGKQYLMDKFERVK
jgi:hypothetical protein